MTRRDFMRRLGLGASALLPGGHALSAVGTTQRRPNIVVIYADDMGWGDVGYHGFSDIMTPSIDRIANEGVFFTQGYVTSSVCGPSRAGLLTGIYPQKFGFGENPSEAIGSGDARFPKHGLPTSQPILAEMLKQYGDDCNWP